MSPMVEKLAHLWPQIVMLTGAAVCLLMGLSRAAACRRAVAKAAGATLLLAGAAVVVTSDPTFIGAQAAARVSPLAVFIHLAVVAIGLLLLMVASGVPERLLGTRDAEEAPGGFDAATAMRGEFFAFFLFSLTGLMLCAGADDLVWLLLALELTSLPTYIMVAVSRDRLAAQEAAVKYFFLGALAVAVFLYGFALIYGATGFTDFESIGAFAAAKTQAGESLPPLLVMGVALAVIGLAFKIAAFPMHFYAADVYEGAATPVTAFLAFVPKAAGFVSLMLVLGLVTNAGGALPGVIATLLALMAVVTMTYGNVMGLLQTNVKRMLAYSSIAHSGYMLVGLLAGVAVSGSGAGDGISGYAAVLFYLVAYGLGNLGGFAVLACLEKSGDEATTLDDLSGLSKRSPLLAAVMLVSMLSLIGLPPMVGFVGKLYLFEPAIDDYTWLVVVAVLNSAVSAVYYLRVTAACYFGEPGADTSLDEDRPRRFAGIVAALGAVIVGVTAGWLVEATTDAVRPAPADRDAAQPDAPEPGKPDVSLGESNPGAE